MNNDLFRIVYCSSNRTTAQEEASVAEVESILAVSRANNARDGVTGALLYSEGSFVQVLEGRLDAVQRTFGRIQCDPRHGDVVVLQAGLLEERLFGAWDMALAAPADPAKASATLSRVLKQPDGAAGTEIVALLAGVLRREGDWAQAAE